MIRAEIRVQFRHVPGNLYNRNFGTDLDQATNELVIRVQPDEAIYLKINNKVPGLGMRLDRSNLNLLYAARYFFNFEFDHYHFVECSKPIHVVVVAVADTRRRSQMLTRDCFLML